MCDYSIIEVLVFIKYSKGRSIGSIKMPFHDELSSVVELSVNFLALIEKPHQLSDKLNQAMLGFSILRGRVRFYLPHFFPISQALVKRSPSVQ